MNSKLEKLKQHKEITGATLFVISTFFQRGLSLITTPLYTRILTSYDYGIVSTYNTWSGILSVIFTLSIAANAFNTGLIKFKENRKSFVGNMIVLTAFLNSLGFIIVTIFRDPVEKFSGISYKFFAVLFINMFCDVVYGFWGLCAKFDNQYVKVVVANLTLTILSIILTFTAIINIDYDAAFVKIIAGSILNCLFAVFIAIKYIVEAKNVFLWKYWKYALTFCLPLIPHYMSNHLLNQADRIMITSMCGAEKTGIYTIAYKMPEILNICWSCVSAVYVPWLYKKLDVGADKEIKKINSIILGSISIITMGIILLGPEVIWVLAPPEYQEGKYLIPAMVTGYYGLFFCLICSHIELFYKKNYFITIITVIAALTNITLNYVFIPKYGYEVAAYTTYIGYTIMLLLHIFNIVRLKLNKYINLKLVFAFFVINSLIGICMLYVYDHIIIRYIILLIILIVCLSQYKKIIRFFKILKEN